ncbi:hypothetical protein EK904_003371 [Melospiza melodia maxima]|nr:hypothetical protein EK904_003371 [Melospiza melodia maxima]
MPSLTMSATAPFTFTMRGIILALALTLVGSQKFDIEPGFSSKKTYVYSYEGWVLNGLQEKNLAKAGVRLSCKLEISGLSENSYLLKIRSPQLEEYNGIWPRDPFTQSSKITQMVSSCLTRPFKFEYSSGRVGNIYGPENCPDTCINIVRGILNMIQITIKKSQNVYELQEAGIGGVCHTRYVIQEDKKNNRVSVTKTVDQNNCQEKVVKSLGMAYVYPCPVDMMKERIIKGTAAFSYKLKQSDSGALITEAGSQQVYQISPFSEPTGVAVTEAKQQLTLLEVKSEWGSSPDISMQNYGSLQYQFPAVLPQMSVQLIKTKNPEQRIIETLQHIVLNNQQDFHDDLPYRFLELVQLCKLTSADTLESLWRQCSDKPRYRRWLLSAVSATGTPEALKFIKSRIRSDDLSYLQALLSVPFALHFTKADEHTVPIAADLVTSSRVQKNPLLQQLASLGYSSVVNRYCSQTSACPKEALQPIHDLADEALSRGREDKMKLALKCIGNMGEPASIKRILKFLPIFSSSASDIPIHIQIDAIMALRKIAWKDCKTVQGYLIQILADESLSPEVRMMACAVIFETRPALPLITTIANVAMKESNLQVASFVYSHMKALSKSRLPYTYNISSACNIALKLLAPKLDRLSYRYSKVIRVGGYFDNYKVGAAGEVLVMNSPGTMFPSAIISKLMAYSAGSVADLVEAGVRVEGLTDVIMKRNIPFAEYSTYKKIKEIGKALLGWKELPTETPLISAYFKLFGQELAYININKEVLQQAVKAVLEPAGRSTLLRRAAAQLRAGTAAQWTQPLWLGELRYIVPTAPGLPLEYSSYSTALARAAASVDGKISPPLTGDFKPSQLLESTVQIRSDINPSLYIQKFATMGVNTEYFQQAVEIQGKVLTRVPIKFDAKIDMKLKNIKIETNPCHEETELVVGRHKAFAVSRNLGELGVEKRTAILPGDASSNIVEEPFKPSDKASSEDFTKPAADSAPRKRAHGSQEDLGPVAGRKAHKRDICVKLQHLGCQLCFASRSRDASFLKNTYLHRLIGEHEAKIVLIPVETDAAIDKIQLEIQAGSRAASKIINEVNAESEEEGESSLYGDIQAKLKKILGIDNVFKASDWIANKTRHPKKQPAKKENTVLTELGADPDTKHPSSSSSASSAASSSSSSAVSPRHVKAPVLAVFLHGIRDDKKIGGLQLVVYADIDSIKPRMQVFVSNLTDSSKWKLCADASVHNAHKAKAYLKWGRNCQDYKVSSELVTGQFAAHPAVQVKLEWPKVPSSIRSVAEWFYKFVPGAAFMLGFSEKVDKNPSRQARVIVALTSPRTCDVVIKLPDITLYEKAMRLPLSLPVGPRTSTSELQPPSWNVFAKAPSAVLENLKAQCSVSYNKISTFNEVRFNYTMPADCYHILAQDCSSDLKFLVMMKNVDESVNLKVINIKIGNHEVDMRPADGRVQLLVDGAESPANVSLTSAGASLWIHSENQGLALLAPAYGIDKLYFDGYTFRIQVALWMAGKMCGLCGKYDAECEQEYRMPNGYVAKDAVSFGHSWILEERPCRGDGQCGQTGPLGGSGAVSRGHKAVPPVAACKLRHAFVKLERAVQLAGVESRCLSTEPVLRCNKGCAPTRTAPVTVGFHCVPADSATSLTDKQMKFDQKSEDMKDTTYLYSYESIIMHGFPDRSMAMAGLRLASKVEISRVSLSEHLLQIRSPKLEEHNGFWPIDSFTPSSRLSETIAACLSQPFKFEYTEGRVGSIFAPEDCPVLCTNLARGVLNMLQITIKKTQNVYELQEAGIEGICQTRYVIQDDSMNKRATVSKSKDLTDCQDKAVRNLGMAYVRPCPTCALKARNIKGTVTSTYKIRYDDSGASLMSAMSDQVYQISPFNEPNGAAVVEVRQELSLVGTKRPPLSEPTVQLHKQGSLRYHFSGELLQMPIPLLRIKNPDLQVLEAYFHPLSLFIRLTGHHIITLDMNTSSCLFFPQLTETLRQLVENNEKGATKEAIAKFLQVIQLFRVATLDQIESLWLQFVKELPYRPWFLSAICAAGATDTFRFLKQKIHDKKLNIWEAAVTLPLAFHFVTPNIKTLEIASSFLTCPQIQKVLMHRIIVYLGYGSMVNKYCAHALLCPNELLQPLHDLATEATSRGDAKDMSLALKAMGNAGEPASIKPILKFLPTFSAAAASLPNRIHVDAVLALRKIARKDPAKVRELTLQVFMDSTLAPNVRMVACVVLFETKPALPTVTALATSLLTEPSLQVASFAYSHMKALAAGRIPQLHKLSAACNVAIKLLGPRLDRLSYRYSKVIQISDYSFQYQAGAIWRVYLMNSPSTMFPSDIITKVRGYYANTAMDIIEVAFRSQGLTKLLRKQNIPFADYDTYKTLKELGKSFLGWKELPPEDPLVSAYIKVFGQEIAFADIDKEAIQQTMMSLTGSSDWQPVVKKVVEEVQRGISGRWTLPVLVAEMRHIVPTVAGLPLELGLCGATVAQAVADVDVKLSPPVSDNFKPSQLWESKTDIHADIRPKAYFHMIAMMGINTQYFQSGFEYHAEFSANTTMKFDARINMKEKNLKIETLPCHQEVELAAARSEVYAISRNMEEVNSEKKSQIFPKGEIPSISDQESTEGSSKPGGWKQSSMPNAISKGYQKGPEEIRHNNAGRRFHTRRFCKKFESLGCSTCLSLKSQNSASLRNTYLHELYEEFEAKIILKPVRTDADIDKIQLEVQAGPKAASKIIEVSSSGSKEEGEAAPYEDIQAKLKKILGIEEVLMAANKTRRRTKRINREYNTEHTGLWAEPSTPHLSSSSSSSAASSAEGREPGDHHRKDERRQSGQQRGSRSSSGSSAGSTACSSSSSKEDHSGDRHCSGDREYSNQQDTGGEILNISISSSSSSASDEDFSRAISQPEFLGDRKPPILAAVLRAIYRNKQPTGFQLVLYTDTQPKRWRIQMFGSSITGPSRWKLCADASVINYRKISGSLKWGKNCQDYQIATQIAAGQFAAYPAMQMKLEWLKVPSLIQTTARWFYSFLPGAAYLLGFSQRQQLSPSHQATLVMALTSPRTCDVVFKLPELTIYDTAISLPLPVPSHPGTAISASPSSGWKGFSQATFSLIESLKGHCTVFQNKITTFNGVEFNYSMPVKCYHVLVQDCSPELKFLVTVKRLEEAADLIAVNVRVASHEIDMYVSNGLIQLKINGVQAPKDFPYTSNTAASMLLSSEKKGLTLKAPDYGIDKIYYDGHRLEIQVAFWMAGKTCGICGKYDAEIEREYQTPSGYLAKDAVSFGHSWIVSEDPCTGGTKISTYINGSCFVACKLQHKLVKSEKPLSFEKAAEKCFSVEPVLRCVKGCSATQTVSVSVGFHCVPADSALSLDGQLRLDQKSEDVVSSVSAHTACSCQQQCPA